MVWWQYLLFPFTLLYDLITRLRNHLFNIGVTKSFRFQTNVISVGNLAVGGTGKTPMVTYLIDYLKTKELNVSTLSRGYGRNTKGFRIAAPAENARSIGDEPYMYYLRYGDRANVTVGEDRVLAIPELLYHFPETDVVLLDDAYQHRTVSASLNIMLTTYQRPFYKDHVLPGGRLREARSGAGRAAVIVVTKCPPSLTAAEQKKISDEIARYSEAQVFFTAIDYGDPVPVFENGKKPCRQVVAISGIANADLFHQHVSDRFRVKISHRYRDHHKYTKLDVKGVINEMDSATGLVTTEKDAAKLREFPELKAFSCFYIPIAIRFLDKEALFQSIVEERIKNYRQESR